MKTVTPKELAEEINLNCILVSLIGYAEAGVHPPTELINSARDAIGLQKPQIPKDEVPVQFSFICKDTTAKAESYTEQKIDDVLFWLDDGGWDLQVNGYERRVIKHVLSNYSALGNALMDMLRLYGERTLNSEELAAVQEARLVIKEADLRNEKGEPFMP